MRERQCASFGIIHPPIIAKTLSPGIEYVERATSHQKLCTETLAKVQTLCRLIDAREIALG